MDAELAEQIRASLIEKRTLVKGWLEKTEPSEKQLQLGPADEQAVQAHLEVIDRSLEKASSEELGICTVCHTDVDAGLLEMDYTASVCLEHYSSQERRILEQELELAQVVQRSLLPQELPEIPKLEIAAFSRPAQLVGGDYFDFFQFRDEAQGLAIADGRAWHLCQPAYGQHSNTVAHFDPFQRLPTGGGGASPPTAGP
jgi:RNA polymerase-binding transcription factor DksA